MTIARRCLHGGFVLLLATAGACRSSLTPAAPAGNAAPAPAGGEHVTPRPAPGERGAYEELAQLLRAAARDNPRLAAARSRWLAARARPAQVAALPDPMVTYTEMLEPIQTRVGPLERSVQIRQGLPFPGKLSAAGAAASEEARVRELEYHIALRDTVAEVKVVHAELVYLHRAVAIVEQNRRLATQLAEKATAAYAGQGKPDEDGLTLFDTLKAQSSLAQLAYDQITLAELLEAEQAKLNGLLSRAPDAPLPAPRGTPFRSLQADRAELYRIARARRQEIQAAVHRIRGARHAERLARLSQVPDFTLGLQYSFIGDGAGPVAGRGDDAVGVSLGFTLPLWGGKNRARVEEARQRARAATYERRAAVDDVLARISRAFFKLKNAERLVRLYEGSLVPQAERALRIAEQWHGAGRDTYGRLLEARMVWLNFQLAAQRARADHAQGLARLEQLVGISLGHLLGSEKKP